MTMFWRILNQKKILKIRYLGNLELEKQEREGYGKCCLTKNLKNKVLENFEKNHKDKDFENLELEKICMTTCCNHQNEILQKSSIKIKHLMI